MQFYESPNVALWFFTYIMPNKPAGVQQFLSGDKKNLSGDESSLFCSAANMQIIITVEPLYNGRHWDPTFCPYSEVSLTLGLPVYFR